MQIKYLLAKRTKVWGIDEAEYSQKAYSREKMLRSYQELRKQGASESTILETLGVSRSGLYRWKKRYKQLGLAGLEDESRRPRNTRKPQWSEKIARDVLFLRRKNPLYGKYKIATILNRGYKKKVSVSTAGRIISKFIQQQKIQPASFYYERPRKKWRIFNNHARRIPGDIIPKQPGELLQIDHMTVNITSDYSVKHFQLVCPITRIAAKRPYSRATSKTAKDFLLYAQKELPFDIISCQVDGGSEFMGEFEQACETLGIPLYVIPPRTPEDNGNVERANKTSKYEFYSFYQGALNLGAMRSKMRKFVQKYNTFRPHQALQYLTPMQYYRKLTEAQSHMY
jgi:transposase